MTPENFDTTCITVPRLHSLHLVGAIFVSLFFFSLYIILDWGLFLWSLCAYLTQFIIVVSLDSADVQKRINVSDFSLYVKREQMYKIQILVAGIITFILNLFPLFVLFEPLLYTYDGSGYELSIIVVLIEFFWIYWLKDELKRNLVKEAYLAYDSTGLTAEQSEYIENQKKDKEEQQKLQKYGASYKEIKLIGARIILSEEKSIIVIDNVEYRFRDIIDVAIYDKSLMIQSFKTTTNVKSAVSRAIVGGVLAGGVGAIVGANTAKKNTHTDESASSVSHDYSLYITVDNLQDPLVKIHVGWDETKLNEIYSVFKIIIRRNQEII